LARGGERIARATLRGEPIEAMQTIYQRYDGSRVAFSVSNKLGFADYG
jgi:hypothetical protein